MQRIERTYEKISAYLKGLLSDRERHDLERSAMQDAFDEVSFEGLNTLSGEEFDAAMADLNARLDKRTTGRRPNRNILLYRIAASLVLILGLGAVLYIVLRQPQQELISQDVHKTRPESTIVQPAPVTENKAIEVIEGNKGAVPATKSESSATDEDSPFTDELDITAEEELHQPAVGEVDDIIPPSPVEVGEPVYTAAPEKEKKAMVSTAGEPGKGKYVSGRVLGANSEALAGVTVQEKGTNRSTLTDINGYFNMQLSGSDSRLAFNYIGYNPTEISSSEIGNTIVLEENLVALNEVVVVGYGTKSRTRKSVSEANKSREKEHDQATDTFIKPVPPGGNLKRFENWVEEQVDTLNMQDVSPGNYLIKVNLHINANGTPENVSIISMVPETVAEEYKRAVMLSPPWKPAVHNNIQVDAEIIIEFHLLVK